MVLAVLLVLLLLRALTPRSAPWVVMVVAVYATFASTRRPEPYVSVFISEADRSAAREAAERARLIGPVQIPLNDTGVLELPAGYVFVPMPEAERLLRAFSPEESPRAFDGLRGLVIADDGWLCRISYIQQGHVSDTDAADLADETAIQRRMNEVLRLEWIFGRAWRRALKVQEAVLIAPPTYDITRHRLDISWAWYEGGGDAQAGRVVQAISIILTRHGYVVLNSMSAAFGEDGADVFAELRQRVEALSDAWFPLPEHAYNRFDAARDQRAGHGLVAFVMGEENLAWWQYPFRWFGRMLVYFGGSFGGLVASAAVLCGLYFEWKRNKNA